ICAEYETGRITIGPLVSAVFANGWIHTAKLMKMIANRRRVLGQSIKPSWSPLH
ncbi:hypothetical protein M9458_056626, partial [Cirrhinus mrigala]